MKKKRERDGGDSLEKKEISCPLDNWDRVVGAKDGQVYFVLNIVLEFVEVS